MYLVARSLHAWRGGVQVPFPTSSDSLPLGNVCKGLLPKGECHHWQVFFPLKEVFSAVSLLSPMSGWQSFHGLYSFVSIYPSIHPSTYLPTYECLPTSTYLLLSLSLPGWAYYLYTVWISISLSLSVCLSAWLPACLPAYLSVSLPLCV